MVSTTTYGAPPFQPGMTSDAFVPDQLIGGDMKIVTKTETITGGAIFKRGTVLGKITANGKWTQALAASSDGSQVPARLLVDDTDTTGGDVTGGTYQMGEFNANAVILGTGITLSAATAALEAQNIYLKTPVSAADPT